VCCTNIFNLELTSFRPTGSANKSQPKTTLTKEILSVASQEDKLSLVRMIGKEILNAKTITTKKGDKTIVIVVDNNKKIEDLLLLCEDSDTEVVIACIKQLVFVFCDILPDYKIREEVDTKKEGKVFLSKDVRRIREQEAYLLEVYKKFLKILETFSKFKLFGMSDVLKDKYMELKVSAYEAYAI
jgi:signal recognition particle receptor subunit beta